MSGMSSWSSTHCMSSWSGIPYPSEKQILIAVARLDLFISRMLKVMFMVFMLGIAAMILYRLARCLKCRWQRQQNRRRRKNLRRRRQ